MQRIVWLIGVCVCGLVLMAGLPPAAKADLNLHAELTNEKTDSKVTDKETGQVTSSDRDRFDQLYNIDIGRNLYPNLAFRAGGIFQYGDVRSTSEGTITRNHSELLHPFLELNLSNPIFTTGFGYDTTMNRQSATGQVTTKDTRDQVHGRFLWTPVDLPRLNLNYTKTHRYDELAKTANLKQDDVSLNLRYDWHDIYTNYSYVTSKTHDLVRGLKSQRDAHDGRISFNHDVTRDLNLNASYRTTYSTEEYAGGGQPFLAPLSPGNTKGFYVLDDSDPLDWQTPPQPEIKDGNFLVDGVKSGSSSINLGLNGDETKNVSFGLDFGFATRFSTIRVWVDSDATEVANAFVWTLYVSDDNRNWTVQAQTQPVRYVGGIDNYFEFTLSDTVGAPITARYVKVVTMPLTTAADPAGHFRDLYVTEVEPFSLEQGNIIRRNMENSADMGLLWQLDPKTSMGYSVFYRYQRTEAETTSRNSALSQTVNLNRTLSRIFTGSVRGIRDARHSPTQNTLDYSYGASLAAGWLDTFRQTLSYNGTWSKIKPPAGSVSPPKEINRTSSVVLRNVAELYRGWSVNIDFGYILSYPWEEEKRTSRLFRVESTMIPNPKLTVNTGYFYTSTHSNIPSSKDQRLELSISLSPTRAMSIFSRLTIIDQDGTSKSYQNYSVDWSPFPDGALQLFVSYSEDLTSEKTDTKTALVGFDWRVNSGTVLRTSLNKNKAESMHDKTDSKVITVTLRISL
jgi:hypothetical protein